MAGAELFQQRDLDFQDAVKAHAAGMGVKEAKNGLPFVFVPDGYTFKDLTDTLPERVQRQLRGDIPQGSVSVKDTPSFLAYVEKFKGDGTALFADRDRSTVIAHLDYHAGAAKPGERKHTVTLNLGLSRQWKTWTGINRKRIEQSAFGEFIEDNLPDIVEPDAADLLEGARDLTLHKEVTFESRAKVADGSMRFNYEENVSQGKRESGSFEIPERLKLNIPLFENGAPIDVEVRLRYKLDDGKLYFTVILDQAESALDSAFTEILTDIEKGTGFKPYLGAAA